MIKPENERKSKTDLVPDFMRFVEKWGFVSRAHDMWVADCRARRKPYFSKASYDKWIAERDDAGELTERAKDIRDQEAAAKSVKIAERMNKYDRLLGEGNKKTVTVYDKQGNFQGKTETTDERAEDVLKDIKALERGKYNEDSPSRVNIEKQTNVAIGNDVAAEMVKVHVLTRKEWMEQAGFSEAMPSVIEAEVVSDGEAG